MYKLILAIISVAAMGTISCAQQKSGKTAASKILVAYFSATGNTIEAAKKIADATGGKLFAITPAQAYTSTDLDWNDRESRSSREMADNKSRPALKNKFKDISNYDVVLIGYPIWWDLAPRIINTFIETHDLKGKTLIPFATSGGSSIKNSADNLELTYPTLKWKKGKLLNGMNKQEVANWVKELGH